MYLKLEVGIPNIVDVEAGWAVEVDPNKMINYSGTAVARAAIQVTCDEINSYLDDDNLWGDFDPYAGEQNEAMSEMSSGQAHDGQHSSSTQSQVR